MTVFFIFYDYFTIVYTLLLTDSLSAISLANMARSSFILVSYEVSLMIKSLSFSTSPLFSSRSLFIF